ncbi:MAG: hypothetical protein WA988_03905 [Candidatus Nanopelagicales bacterium]
MLSRRSRFAALVAIFLGVFVLAPAASPAMARAAETEEPLPINLIDMSVAGLARNPPFFQVSRAPLAISDAEIARVVTAIGAAGTPVYIVILPGTAVRAVGTSQEIQQKLGLPGTYLTIVGTVYETYSTEFAAKEVLTRAFAEERNNGTTAVLVRFAQLSGLAAVGPLPTPDVVAWRPTIIVVGSVLVIGIGYLLISGRRNNGADEEQAAPPGAVDVPSAG